MNLKPLLEPKTMAVIGVSATNERHPANVIYDKNNHRYPVEVFAVNPKGGRLHGEKLYSRINDEAIRPQNHPLTIERTFYYIFALLIVLIRSKRGRHVIASSRIPATPPARLGLLSLRRRLF